MPHHSTLTEQRHSYIQLRYKEMREQRISRILRFLSPKELTVYQLESIDRSLLSSTQRSSRGLAPFSIPHEASRLYKEIDPPVGFDPITWFLIGKIILEILLWWFQREA